MQWLMVSIVLSILLTVALNVAARAFPGGTDRAARRLDEWTARSADYDGPRVRVFFPWRAMLIGSIVLTILVNVFARR
jgi:hypothetical protein